MTPPPPSRRAKNAYISKEDFAQLLGAGRATVFRWLEEDGGSYPEERYRIKLAKLSKGRYQPEDFQRPAVTRRSPLELELRTLRSRQEALKDEVDRIDPLLTNLVARVEALERRDAGATGTRKAK